MYENPFDRKFGIEFEFACVSVRNGSYSQSESGRRNFERILAAHRLGDFRVGFDGSEWEVKTPILQGPNGFKRVKRFLDLALELGARANIRNDGLHVHHDAPEFLDEMGRIKEVPTKQLVENWLNNQNQIYQMVDSSRINRWSCPAWTSYDLNMLNGAFERGTSSMGRKNLNISALNRHGTIEFRLHEGTLDYEEVLSWVRFGQAFIGKAVKETDAYIEDVSSASELIRSINVSRNASRFLNRKIAGSSSFARAV